MVACDQALQGALAAGRGKEGELATTSLEFEFYLQFACGSPSTELSDFQQSARSGKERDCKQKTRAKGNGVITNVISANQHFASTYSFSRDVATRSPSFCRRAARAPQRACSQAIYMAHERAAMGAEKMTLLGGFCYLNGRCINVKVNEFLKR